MFVVGFTILGIIIFIVLYCVIKRQKTLRNQLDKLKMFNLKSDPSSDSVIAKELHKNQFDIKNVTSGKIHFNDLKTKGNDHIGDPIQSQMNQLKAASSVINIGDKSAIKSISGTDISSDSMIAKHWQHNQFDIKMVTSGAIHLNDMKTKGNKDVSGATPDPIQIDNDQLIAAEVAKNDHEIYQFTQGNLGKNEWKTIE